MNGEKVHYAKHNAATEVLCASLNTSPFHTCGDREVCRRKTVLTVSLLCEINGGDGHFPRCVLRYCCNVRDLLLLIHTSFFSLYKTFILNHFHNVHKGVLKTLYLIICKGIPKIKNNKMPSRT